MSREERQARAQELAGRPTRADRLHAVIERLNPPAAEHYAEIGQWKLPSPPPWRDPNDPDAAAVAPYIIRELDDGRQQIQVVGADGDVLGAIGESVEAALAALEGKLR